MFALGNSPGKAWISSCGTAASSRRAVAAAAAKKGGSKKGAQKKGGSALAELLKKKEEAANAPVLAADSDGFATPDQYKDPDVIFLLMMICSSYKKHYNEFLMETGFDQLAEAFYKAPFACLAHNKFEEGVDDPVFVYANKAALQLWEADWNTLVGMPSRLSAEPVEREGRQALLDQAAAGGALKGYEVRRVSTKGKRFKLRDVRLFNVLNTDGSLWGQAAVIPEYELEDGTVVKIQGEAPPPSAIEIPPSEEDVAAAESAVAEQAAAVRSLKEQQGLTNQDPAVQAAVAELQQRKQELSEVQAKYQAALQEAAAAAAAPLTVESWEEDGDAEKAAA